jgi:hypothetical protein
VLQHGRERQGAEDQPDRGQELAIPPRENSSSIASTPELLTKPVAMAAKLALMAVATGPSPGSSTKAVTAAD